MDCLANTGTDFVLTISLYKKHLAQTTKTPNITINKHQLYML